MAVKRTKSTRTTRPAAKTPRVPRRAPAKKAARSATGSTLREVVLAALDDMKAVDISALDVRGLTDITDTMIVASGTSDRHVRSIADRVVQRCKEAGFRPFGMEGERDGEWVLLDLNDVVLHVMLPRVRRLLRAGEALVGRRCRRLRPECCFTWSPPARACRAG